MPTILYADHNPKALRFLTSVFEMCGYTVLTACDPCHALALVEAASFDVAILDYALPEMSSAWLVKQIRRIKPSVPVLLYSRRSAVCKEDLRLFDAFVTKGESVEVLLGKLQDLLRPLEWREESSAN
jgi:CheY-like chemotaxis protein